MQQKYDTPTGHLSGHEMKTEWIKVEDRLPPIRESVLYLLHDFDMYIGGYSRTKKEWWVDSTDDYYWNKEDVTHWMPIPEMPKDTVGITFGHQLSETPHGQGDFDGYNTNVG